MDITFCCLRFADIKYTQSGFEHMELAKTYYSQAAKLNPDNMRALYGLLLVSKQSQFWRIFGNYSIYISSIAIL